MFWTTEQSNNDFFNKLASSRQFVNREILPTSLRATSSVHPICGGSYKNGLDMAAPFLHETYDAFTIED